jgi:hypothetical protein
MFSWLKVEIDTLAETGEVTDVRYSHTPEEFIAELKRRNEYVYVARPPCIGCHYTPEHLAPRNAVDTMDKQSMSYHRIPECIRITIAHFMQNPNVPDFVTCYGFYYLHWHQNKYLRAVKEAVLVIFQEVKHLPDLQESGLKLTGYFD